MFVGKNSRKTLLVFATKGRGGSNHSEVIIKGDIVLMFGVFESCILKWTLGISSCADVCYYSETERLLKVKLNRSGILCVLNFCWGPCALFGRAFDCIVWGVLSNN